MTLKRKKFHGGCGNFSFSTSYLVTISQLLIVLNLVSAHEDPHRRETVRLRHLLEGLQPEELAPDPHEEVSFAICFFSSQYLLFSSQDQLFRSTSVVHDHS